MASNVSSVYVNVIDDVVDKVRGEFIGSGAGESVLSELQALWETKMMRSGVISGNIERQQIQRPAAGPITPVHDLNVPYEGPIEEYETPTAEMLFPPTPLQTPMQTPMPQTPMPGSVDYNMPTGTPDFAPVNDMRKDIDIKAGRPSPYMQPPSPWMSRRPLGVDVNLVYDEGREDVERGPSHQPLTQNFFMTSSGKRKRDEYPSQLTSGTYLPQQDGSGDITIEFFLPECIGVPGQHKMEVPAFSFDLKISVRCLQMSDISVIIGYTTLNDIDTTPEYLSHLEAINDTKPMEKTLVLDFSANEVQNSSGKGRQIAIAAAHSGKEAKAGPMLPQQDGIHDEYDNLFPYEGVATEDYNTVNTPADHVELQAATPSVGTPKPTKSEALDDEEPPLNEDDDDDDDLDEVERGEEEPQTQHLVLAQFDKVTRTKSRWKCTLKDGIMHLNNRDILFNKATGEFDF